MSEARHPTLADVIDGALAAGLQGIRLSIPARVVAYDRTKQAVSVQPLIKERVVQEDETIAVERLPVVQNVPVAFYRAGGFHVVFPINVGDTGMLEFSDAAMDKWLSEGGEIDPLEGRAFTLNDCVFTPGVRSFKDAVALPDENAVVIGKEAPERIERVPLGESLLEAINAKLDSIQHHTHSSDGTETTSQFGSIDADDVLSTSAKVTD